MSWITKHRPRELEDFIGHKNLIEQCRNWIEAPRTMPNLLFYGPPGTGKTSLAGLIVRKTIPIPTDIPLFQNAAKLSKMAIGDLMLWIKQLKIQRIGGKQGTICAVIDEADLLSYSSQTLLALLLVGDPILPDSWNRGRDIRFIFITNHIERIHPSLREVCLKHEFTLKKREMHNIIRNFFNIRFKDPMCETILKNTNFDLRRVSVLSDFKDLFGMECFQDYINDAEKKELVSQILGGEFEIDEWQRRGQLINDFVANLGDILDPLDFLFLERDVVKEKFGDATIREWLIRQKLDKINAGSINDEEDEQRNAPAAS